MCCGGGLRSDRHGDFQLLPFHCSLYFFVCSKYIFIGKMWSFHFILSYLGTNPHHFFPTLPRVGHDPFAVAAVPVSVTFHCCEISLPLSSTKAVSFDVGQLRNVPAGTGAEPVSAFPRRCHPGLGRWHFVPDTRGPYACRTGSSVCIYEHKERCQVLFVIIQLENIT